MSYSLSGSNDLFSLFCSGYPYYAFTYGKYNEVKHKQEIKIGKKDKLVTPNDFTLHLQGTRGVSVSPFYEQSECQWCALDIDKCDFDIDRVAIGFYKAGFPCVVTYSKSEQHLHVYFFFSERIQARNAVELMKKYKEILCLKHAEIFPKQVDAAQCECPSPLIVPYFNVDEIKGRANKAIIPAENGYKIADTMEFCDFAHQQTRSLKDHEEALEKWEFYSAPPCVRMGAFLMKADGAGRNNWLFNVMVWLKLRNTPNLEMRLQEINEMLDDPLDEDELYKTILKSSEKETYFYRCVMETCYKDLCRISKDGIKSTQSSGFDYGQMTQILTDPPTYSWVVNGQLLRFHSEEDILNQKTFRNLSVRLLGIAPRKISDNDWIEIVNKALENIQIEYPAKSDDDFSVGATLEYAIVEYFKSRYIAANRNQINANMIYKDEEKQCFVFNAKGLLDYLRNKAGIRLDNNDIRDKIIAMGAQYGEEGWEMPMSKIHLDDRYDDIIDESEEGEEELEDAPF